MSNAERTQDAEWDVMEAVGAACALASATESGLLGSLTSAPRRVSELAAELGLAAEPARLVLDVLVAEGLAVRTVEGYAASERLAHTLARMPPQGLLPFRGLSAVLTGGVRAVEMDRDAATRAATYRTGTPALADTFAGAAAELAAHLGGAERILDLGCGAGGWSLALARACPTSRVTGVDFAGVLGAMEERAAREGLADRVDLVAADLRTDELPVGYDLVLLANVLRLERPDVARAMLARAAGCVADGGRLVVVDALAQDTPAARRSLALYALHLSLRTTRGGVHERATVAGWLSELGFSEVEPVTLERGPAHLGALVAR